MRRLLYAVGLTLVTVVVLGHGVPASAQQPPRELVPFKGTLSGVGSGVMIPTDPPVLVGGGVATGEDSLLGACRFVDCVVIHLGVDGKPLYFDNGILGQTAANGDALFATYSGLDRPAAAATPHLIPYEGAATITGGRGRFAGATGSVTFKGLGNLTTGEYTVTYEGLLSAPNLKQ